MFSGKSFNCLLSGHTWLQEEFEDIKGVIKSRISKNNRQHNGQKKKDKQRSAKHTLPIKLEIKQHEPH